VVIVVKQEAVKDVFFENGQVVIFLACDEALWVTTALLNRDGITAWGERQHTCEQCGVQYVAE
jgi:hypothetical protein